MNSPMLLKNAGRSWLLNDVRYIIWLQHNLILLLTCSVNVLSVYTKISSSHCEQFELPSHQHWCTRTSWLGVQCEINTTESMYLSYIILWLVYSSKIINLHSKCGMFTFATNQLECIRPTYWNNFTSIYTSIKI